MNLVLLATALTMGQPAVPPPVLPASPFLAVKVSGPEGTKVTFYPGTKNAVVTAETVGLRPGYPYRLQMTNLPASDKKGAIKELYPTLEVRGTLVPRADFDVSKHPVPIIITDRDVDQIIAGRSVTKYYYLEDPETALPVQGSAKEPLELQAISEAEASRDAQSRGRLVLVLRVGDRQMKAEELANEAIDGTILLPGAKSLPIPVIPPLFGFGNLKLYDPIIGPKPSSQECLHDGGDTKTRVGITDGGKLLGLDASDSAMTFKGSKGYRVSPSNRVCVCVPRFVAARVDIGIGANHSLQTPQGNIGISPPAGLHAKEGTTTAKNTQNPAGTQSSIRASGLESKISPQVLEQMSGKASGLSSVSGVLTVAQLQAVDEITSNCQSLMLQKRIEPNADVKIGDIVTITLTFKNPTTEAMTEVSVNDSLTARMEYVEGSAKCSRPATFTATTNDVGSSTLRWAIDGKLQPGQSGVITFQVKIR